MRPLFILLLMLLQGGIVVTAEATAIRILPDKGFYRPGDIVNIQVFAPAGTLLDARITYLADVVAEIFAVPVMNGAVTIQWTPPLDSPRGYGITVTVYDEARQIIAGQSGAFDVLEHWTDAPRYGFFSDFTVSRDNYEATLEWMLRHHINGVQFYDWQYRWEDLLPETDLFDDGLGRPQSMITVRRLIDLVRGANIAAMPYTAIYGVSAPYFHVHPDWGLFNANGEVNRLGEDLIAIFDPTPGSPWNAHLLAEFADVLDNTLFDGIHIDQYGSPKNGYDAAGNYIDLAQVFPQFIQQADALVDEKRGSEGAVIFNLVGNWPVETVAPVNPDATYIEVWPPHDDYADLHRIIAKAQSLSSKPVILAAYIPPENVINWRLSNAVIFASGAYHLETGEPGGMLQHPYFPEFGQIPEAERANYARYYDFLVRYENVLSLATPSDRDSAVSIEGIRTRGLRAIDRVMPIVREGNGFETISLVNFRGIDFSTWNALTTIPPQPFENLQVKFEASRPVKRVWAASPDRDSTMNAVELPFTVENGVLNVTIPQLNYWTMIVVEYDDL
jgi:dextranase